MIHWSIGHTPCATQSVATRGWLEGAHVDLIGDDNHILYNFQVWSIVLYDYDIILSKHFLSIGLRVEVHEASAPQQPHVAAPRCPLEGVDFFYPNCKQRAVLTRDCIFNMDIGHI